jgi:hypothetical protein
MLKAFVWSSGIMFIGSVVVFLNKEGNLQNSWEFLNIFSLLSPYDYSLLLLSALGGILLDSVIDKDEMRANRDKMWISYVSHISFCFLPFVFLLIFLAFLKGKNMGSLREASVFNVWNLLSFVFIVYLKALFIWAKSEEVLDENGQ